MAKGLRAHGRDGLRSGCDLLQLSYHCLWFQRVGALEGRNDLPHKVLEVKWAWSGTKYLFVSIFLQRLFENASEILKQEEAVCLFLSRSNVPVTQEVALQLLEELYSKSIQAKMATYNAVIGTASVFAEFSSKSSGSLRLWKCIEEQVICTSFRSWTCNFHSTMPKKREIWRYSGLVYFHLRSICQPAFWVHDCDSYWSRWARCHDFDERSGTKTPSIKHDHLQLSNQCLWAGEWMATG